MALIVRKTYNVAFVKKKIINQPFSGMRPRGDNIE
jgi:hypothetical protein